jgi:hypothetical protein
MVGPLDGFAGRGAPEAGMTPPDQKEAFGQCRAVLSKDNELAS